MNLVLWGECNRTLLRELLPEALVLLATGATEQHGPHLATGTDILVSSTLVERAALGLGPERPRPSRGNARGRSPRARGTRA